MSSPAPVTADIYRWTGRSLELLDYCDMTGTTIRVADSWLVEDGRTLAIDVHKARFLEQAGEASEFLDAAIASIPRTGDWFPRVELHANGRLLFRLRSAPARTRSVVLATHHGDDPRTTPTVKGPDLDAMRRLRTAAQGVGADEAVILSPDGYVVEGSYSSLVWWRGAILCFPPAEFERVAGVTARSLIGLATALGVETLEEAVTPPELDGTEVWALNSLQGPRIVTSWVDGPGMAELPGRLAQWRLRLGALARPLPVAT
jgi:hypothetical protein